MENAETMFNSQDFLFLVPTKTVPRHPDFCSQYRDVSILIAFNQMTFSWITPTLELGVERPLEFEDLPALTNSHRARTNAELFEVEWKQQVLLNPTEPSMAAALMNMYRTPFYISALLKFITDSLAMFTPILLEWLIVFVADSKSANPPPIGNGIGIAAGMFACAVLQSVFTNVYFKVMSMLGLFQSSMVFDSPRLITFLFLFRSNSGHWSRYSFDCHHFLVPQVIASVSSCSCQHVHRPDREHDVK
jgi:hypothetical protein